MRRVSSHAAFIFTMLLCCALLAACADTVPATDTGNQDAGSTETSSVETESAEPVDPEPAAPAMVEDLDEIPENIVEAVRQQKDSLKVLLYSARREEMSVDNLQIGQRIKAYEVTENEVNELYASWPIYIDGELVALMTEYEAFGSINYSLDVNTPSFINAAGVDTVALVFDHNRLYLSDGTQLIATEQYTEPVDSRVPITEDNEAEVIAACELGRLGAIIGSVSD